jgi:adenylate cyclase
MPTENLDRGTTTSTAAATLRVQAREHQLEVSQTPRQTLETSMLIHRIAPTLGYAEREVLHNTLPPSIAERLVNNKTFIADSYKGVSVLFMDIVNFTTIAGSISPKQLVYILNSIFPPPIV